VSGQPACPFGAGEPALSVRQPWAGWIAAGAKTVENRSRPTGYRGPVWLHASAAQDLAAEPPPTAVNVALQPRALTRGAVLGLVELTGVHFDRGCCAPWGQPDRWHWQLRCMRLLDAPWPARGALGLWRPDLSATAPAGYPEDLLTQLAAGRAVVVRRPGLGWAWPAELAGIRKRYIGRPSALCNPLRIGPGWPRERVLAGYAAYFAGRPDLQKVARGLGGWALECCCWPLPCHGDVLAAVANAAEVGR